MSDVNNKEKQFSGKNWGHPRKYTKKHTNIANPLIPEVPKYRKKRRKTVGQKKCLPFGACPFCEKELKQIDEEKHWIFSSLESFCRHCGAKEVDVCPACKRKTWIKNNLYKHQSHGCGFEGVANLQNL